jgi:hypothetical protein
VGIVVNPFIFFHVFQGGEHILAADGEHGLAVSAA